MGIRFSVWSRADLHQACRLLGAATRALGIAALAPYLEAVDNDLARAEVSATLAEVTLHRTIDAFDAARGRAIEGARGVLPGLEIVQIKGGEGAAVLSEIAQKAWSPADRPSPSRALSRRDLWTGDGAGPWEALASALSSRTGLGDGLRRRLQADKDVI